MKSNSHSLWCVCVLQAASLLTGGCSGEIPQQPPAPREASAGIEVPVVLEPVAQEPPDKVPADVLSWDALEQRRVVNEGDEPVLFRFRMTNVSREPVVIEKVNVSCGCTTFDARSMPFSLTPGASEDLQIRMSVTGKFGTVTKSILVEGSGATWTLLVTAEVTPSADENPELALSSGAGMSAGTRGRNIRLATADRQAVFKGDCAGCHSRFAEGQFGYGLYLGACAICHDAEHRASMVPNLRAEGVPRDKAYWRQHINEGIEETLMPAFAKEKGGILSDEQIESLVKFLVETPFEPTALRSSDKTSAL